jgi:hypothetical protein
MTNARVWEYSPLALGVAWRSLEISESHGRRKYIDNTFSSSFDSAVLVGIKKQ